jgi:hypothetical protein
VAFVSVTAHTPPSICRSANSARVGTSTQLTSTFNIAAIRLERSRVSGVRFAAALISANLSAGSPKETILPGVSTGPRDQPSGGVREMPKVGKSNGGDWASAAGAAGCLSPSPALGAPPAARRSSNASIVVRVTLMRSSIVPRFSNPCVPVCGHSGGTPPDKAIAPAKEEEKSR